MVLQNLGLFQGMFMKKELVSSGVWLFSGVVASCGIWLKSRMRLRQAYIGKQGEPLQMVLLMVRNSTSISGYMLIWPTSYD